MKREREREREGEREREEERKKGSRITRRRPAAGVCIYTRSKQKLIEEETETRIFILV